MAFYALFALLALCTGPTFSQTASPSPTPAVSYYYGVDFFGADVGGCCPNAVYQPDLASCLAYCIALSGCAIATWHTPSASGQPNFCFPKYATGWGYSLSSTSNTVVLPALIAAAGQTDNLPSSSSSPSPSTSPTPMPCSSAPPGYFCSGSATLICPIGAYCAGGTALNVSCYPMTACTVAGLSAQPPCYWNVSTVASGLNLPSKVKTNASGALYVSSYGGNRIFSITPLGVTSMVGTSAAFNAPQDVALNASGHVFVADNGNHVIRVIAPNGIVTTLAGLAGAGSYVDGVGALARFNQPKAVAVAPFTTVVYIADNQNNRLRALNMTSMNVTTLAGSTAGAANGFGTSAQFNTPSGLALTPQSDLLYVADSGNSLLRLVNVSTVAVTTVGSGLSGPSGVWVSSAGIVYVADQNNHRIMQLVGNSFVTFAGGGGSGAVNGFGTSAKFQNPTGVVFDEFSSVLYVTNFLGNDVRRLQCVPCPASYYCSSGTPLLCLAGSYCPLNSINPTACPAGTFSNAGASNCTFCAAGTFTSATGSSLCQQCPGGHYCPTGTSSWARLNCGRGSYCPDGSATPRPCPFQVPPSGGWGALQVQGPAFLVETAQCLNHCFWNFTSGDGSLSLC